MLVDIEDNECYLGELNPRISGASSITNVTAGSYADVPLFCFHLLEYSGVDFDLDMLGFDCEAPRMRKYTPDGRDAALYARVQ